MSDLTINFNPRFKFILHIPIKIINLQELFTNIMFLIEENALKTGRPPISFIPQIFQTTFICV